MKKKNIIVTVALAALTLIASTTAITIHKNGGLGVFATMTLNEYGCVSNCTGEYYPSSVNQIVKANPELNGKQNVRIIAKKSKDNSLVQDIDYNNEVKNNYSYRNDNRVLLITNFSANGFSFKQVQEGETIAFFGTVSYRENVPFGGSTLKKVVEINDATIYMVGEQKNLDLLPEVVYLQ